MSLGTYKGKKFLLIDRQPYKKMHFVTVQFETGEIDILDEKDVVPLKIQQNKMIPFSFYYIN